MKGGFGYAVARAGSTRVAAFTAVNALGDVRDGEGRIIAGARTLPGSRKFLDTARFLKHGAAAGAAGFDTLALQNTTLAVVVSSEPLDVVALSQLAHAAGAALFRRITPAGSMYDGDIVFALSPEPADDGSTDATDPMVIEALAIGALEDAVERGVRLAHGRDGIPGLADEQS
jgi:L-aminopeptidase/D-esterase-like protein